MSTDASHSGPAPIDPAAADPAFAGSAAADPAFADPAWADPSSGGEPFVPVARTAADLLAIMPHTLAAWPRRSAVLLTASDREPGPCLRVDLPGPHLLADDMAVLEWTAELSELLERDPIGDRLYLALFVDGAPHSAEELERVAEAVGEAAALSDHAVAGSWIVGPHLWFDLDEPEPRTAHDVQEIRSSALWTAMVVSGSTVEEPGRAPAPARRRSAAGAAGEAGLRVEDCRGLARELDRRRCGGSGLLSADALGRPLPGSEPGAALAAWEPLLEHGRHGRAAAAAIEFDPVALVDLLSAVTDPIGSDALAVAVLTGESCRAARAWARALEPEDAPDQDEARGPGRPSGQCRVPDDDLGWMVDVLVGRWGGDPDWERADAFEAVLEVLLDLLHGVPADQPRSAAARDAEAWLWVATAHLERFRARGTWASQWLELAEDAVPGHPGAARARLLGSRFPVPRWAGDPRRGWHRRR